MPRPIALIDLQAQRRRIGKSLDAAIVSVVEGGQWILGPQVAELEKQLAQFAGVKHCISCANGTDALVLVLRAWGVGQGDAVFVPAFTFAATAEAVCLVGASPVFVDVDGETFNISTRSLCDAIKLVRRDGELQPTAVIPVDLFGRPVAYESLQSICDSERLKLLCDCAQSFGARYEGAPVCSFGDASATSFFPAKPLGCYGDGGACFTNDGELADVIRSLALHGRGATPYEFVRIGMNSRLDTIQAAILLEKLKIFPDELALRDKVARRYDAKLGRSNLVRVPSLSGSPGTHSSWSQYAIRVNNRDGLMSALKKEGIPTAIYYPIPLPLQSAYSKYRSVPTPVSDNLAASSLCLPMHPYLEKATQDRIIRSVLKNASPEASTGVPSAESALPGLNRPKVASRYSRKFRR